MESKIDNEIHSTPRPTCRLCGNHGAIIYSNLQDQIFGATGSWNLKKCLGPDCGLIWLDPMPLPAEIAKAYASYYTHAPIPRDHARKVTGRFASFAAMLYLNMNHGYLQSQYG